MIISGDCPHCGTQSVAFNARHQFRVNNLNNELHMLATCNACRMGVIFQLGLHQHTAEADLVNTIGSQDALEIKVNARWPDYDDLVPADVPANIARFYEQGLRALKTGHWDAAGAMFRKTLDVSTKQLRPDLAKKVLFDRIEAMVKSADLTPAMGQWSHRIRLDGNDAIHDEDPETEKDATATKQFTEAFLTYSYSLPALVSAGQEVALQAEAAEMLTAQNGTV